MSTVREARSSRRYESAVTIKGQATIPLAVRRLLGIEPHDRVVFIVEEGSVRIESTVSAVERTAGIFKNRGPVLSDAELKEAAMQAIAEAAVSGRDE
jgi:AbrB family looped-hinge helix DNA binding protein